jgi:hypothetical protein
MWQGERRDGMSRRYMYIKEDPPIRRCVCGEIRCDEGTGAPKQLMAH